MDKIYKILVDILDLKAGFPLAILFIRSDFFRSKTMKNRIDFFDFEKSQIKIGLTFLTSKKVANQ